MRPVHCIVALGLLVLSTASATAQEPPPRIPYYVLDVRGSFPLFPSSQPLAESRIMTLPELPGAGLGAQVGLHLYPLRWRAITFGIGAEVVGNRARKGTHPENEALRASEEKFLSASPQLSFNFGTGHGWSYLSGGVGLSQWSLIPVGEDPIPGDSERLKTINYGGGGRWFAKKHLAFTFDIRFYAINPGTPYLGHVGSPRTTLKIISAGISLK